MSGNYFNGFVQYSEKRGRHDQEGYKSDSDWGPGHRRGKPCPDSVHVQYQTEDVHATVEQIQRLEQAGCDIIRVAVPTMEAASALAEIKKEIHIPLVADIHFDYRLALAAIESGVDKIRLNPGNIGGADRRTGSREGGKGTPSANPHRRKLRLGGEAHSREIRRADTRGHGGKCAVPCRSAERLRF